MLNTEIFRNILDLKNVINEFPALLCKVGYEVIFRVAFFVELI